MKLVYSFLLSFVFSICYSQQNTHVIPLPKSVILGKGSCVINSKTTIQAQENSFEATYLQQLIQEQTGLRLEINSKFQPNCIQLVELRADTITTNKEAYVLNISSPNITISAFSNQGLFYGIQTLVQLLPFEKKNEISIPLQRISDEPKFKWRGMHLDVARHFFPKASIKTYIDYLAMYKLNTFHWHLTDDQGWRIEIKKYPKLTQIGAWRNGSMIGHYNEQKYDSEVHGGYYTQEDIKEIIAYAAQRHITIIPEIEMPGHATAAIASYPELSCTGKTFEVAKQWGVLEDVFCTKPETLSFLKDVLSEVIDLFPAQYIHIGGDECPKTRWKNCPNCQKNIRDLGLKDEHELQSYLVQNIEKFVNSKGRKIIGWDEILEGGLAPNAAVMSWRGTEGGITAAKQKHHVVMSPGSHCYFDFYQGEQKTEPLAIGGYTPIEKVYSYNPIPDELSPEESKYIMGAQGNVWTEYMNDFSKVEYMAMPRMAALAEVVWGKNKEATFDTFKVRLLEHFDRLDQMKINYSRALFEVKSNIQPLPNQTGLEIKLIPADTTFSLFYTTDGSAPTNQSTLYTEPIPLVHSTTIKAASFSSGVQKSAVLEQTFDFHKAIGAHVTIQPEPSKTYAANGALSLVDGIYGDRGKFGRDWLGFSGKDLSATVALNKLTSLHKITIDVISSPASWIYFPSHISVALSSDGITYAKEIEITKDAIEKSEGKVTLNLQDQKAQFIKVNVFHHGKIEEGNPGAGEPAWLFIDEIKID
jgi:hexosaminidase